jgi:dTDP-4-dehydrorhamnose reductase
MRRILQPFAKAPLPLLITGVAGVAGYNAFFHFRRKYGGAVLGTRRRDNWPLQADGVVACDAEDRDELARLFDRHQFAAVLNCGGSCKLKSCELDPLMAWRVNIQGVVNLLDALEGQDVRLVHLSIDLVFSGTRGGRHVEDDPTDPVTVYGKTMEIAERLILQRRPDSCILRISLPMGVSFNGHAGAIDWIQSRFKKNKHATLYFDEIRTPAYTDCLNQVLEDVLASDLAGIYHAGGPRPLSLYQIAQIVNRVGGYRPDRLIGCLRRKAGPMPPRAGDVSMNSSKLTQALGYAAFDPWPADERFVPTHDQWHYERPAEERGSPDLLAEVLYRNPRYSCLAHRGAEHHAG